MAFWSKLGTVLKVIAKVVSGPAGQVALGTFIKNPRSKEIAGGVTGMVGALDNATDPKPEIWRNK